ncbi:MAG TPA: YkvA family protein [Bacilli bacterium]
MFVRVREWAKQLKKQVFLLYLACKDSRTPWFAKVIAFCVVAYAFSPIDFIPDFIPILGYLDDILLIPAGVILAIKLIPISIIDECKVKAEELMKHGRPNYWVTGILIIFIWILAFCWVIYKLS